MKTEGSVKHFFRPDKRAGSEYTALHRCVYRKKKRCTMRAIRQTVATATPWQRRCFSRTPRATALFDRCKFKPGVCVPGNVWTRAHWAGAEGTGAWAGIGKRLTTRWCAPAVRSLALFGRRKSCAFYSLRHIFLPLNRRKLLWRHFFQEAGGSNRVQWAFSRDHPSIVRRSEAERHEIGPRAMFSDFVRFFCVISFKQ